MTQDVIEITQYGVARIQKDNHHVRGLSTKNLNVCLGIILISPKHVLLMHIDTNVDTDYVAKQVAWIDTPYSMKIAINKKQHHQAKLLGLMLDEFSIEGFLKRLKDSLAKLKITYWNNLSFHDASIGEVTIFTNGEIKLLSTTTERVPDFDLRKSINFLNYLSKYDNSTSPYAKLDLDIQYNLTHWTTLSSLSPISEKIVQTYQLTMEWNSFITKLQQELLIPSNLILFLQRQRVGIEREIVTCVKFDKSIALKEKILSEKIDNHTLTTNSGLSGFKKGFFNSPKQPNNTKSQATYQESISPLDEDGEPTTKFEFYKQPSNTKSQETYRESISPLDEDGEPTTKFEFYKQPSNTKS